MEIKLLVSLDDTERQELLRIAVRRRYRKGEVIFHEGDLGDTLHLLFNGRVAIRVSTPLGDVGTLSVLVPGDSFGEQALIDEVSRRTASAEALEPVETLALLRDDFAELRRRHPEVNRLLVDALSAQVRRLSSLVLEALYVPAEKRVLRRLAYLAELYQGDDEATVVTVPITQEELSTMAGTTRPTANRVLQQAVESGVLSLGRSRIEILDVPALNRLAR